MDSENIQQDHVVEVHINSHGLKRNHGGSKICGEVPCELADPGTSSKDAKERSASMRNLFIAVILSLILMSVEIAGGMKANSLAILTDAIHLSSDVAISLFSLWAAVWEATPRQTYGFLRIEILGALVSIQILWLLTGILGYEAVIRLFFETNEVDGCLMFLVAAFGLAFNIGMAFLLGLDHSHGHDTHGHGVTITKHHDHHHGDHHNHDHDLAKLLLDESKDWHEQKKRNINVRREYLHVLSSSTQSVGVMIAGAIIWYKPEWKIVDLVCTLIPSVIVLGTTINMLRSILEVLMECTPREIDATKLEKGLMEMEEVVAIHELHIWAITVGKVLLACHVKIWPEADADLVLDKVIGYIKMEYKISHVTIQIER